MNEAAEEVHGTIKRIPFNGCCHNTGIEGLAHFETIDPDPKICPFCKEPDCDNFELRRS